MMNPNPRHEDTNGRALRVGDRVFFKADYEQHAEVIALLDRGLIEVTDYNGPSQIIEAWRAEFVR